MRVVLDTNVLISALLFDGIPERIFLAGLRGEIQLLTSLTLLEELGRVLKDKFKIDVHTVANTIELVRSVAEIVEVKSRIRVILHPNGDNRVLECAGDGKADVLVTGDTKHILPLSKYKGTRILSPAELVRFLRPSLP